MPANEILPASLYPYTYRRLAPTLFRKSRDREPPFRYRPTLRCRAPRQLRRGMQPETWATHCSVPDPEEARATVGTRTRLRKPAGGTCKERQPEDEDCRTALTLLRHGQAPPTVQDAGILHALDQL